MFREAKVSGVEELPPRARRIHGPPLNHHMVNGTTSACAENTATHTSVKPATRNYLRVRGEYDPLFLPDVLRAELPPRARRIQRFWGWGGGLVGTTSACAENTEVFHQPTHAI